MDKRRQQFESAAFRSSLFFVQIIHKEKQERFPIIRSSSKSNQRKHIAKNLKEDSSIADSSRSGSQRFHPSHETWLEVLSITHA